MRDQEEANACLEVAAATKKKRVGELWVRIFVTAKFFISKFPLNTSPTPSIVLCTIVLHLIEVLYYCAHSFERDVT